jgi:hypothetical protein
MIRVGLRQVYDQVGPVVQRQPRVGQSLATITFGQRIELPLAQPCQEAALGGDHLRSSDGWQEEYQRVKEPGHDTRVRVQGSGLQGRFGTWVVNPEP